MYHMKIMPPWGLHAQVEGGAKKVAGAKEAVSKKDLSGDRIN
jgi:hypothetical protein